MANGRTDVSIPEDCRECKNWERVSDRVRVHSVLTSVVDKIEKKVSADDFKPTLGDYFKSLEALKSVVWGSEGSKEITVKWEDPASKSKR